jgi:uncharacterized protein (DUF1919 family)
MNNILQKIYNKSINIIQLKYKKIYEKKLRKKLKNDEFSILCPNCIGGIIYNRLGKKFLSPTINLCFSSKDFLKFILDLENYLSKELKFIESEYDYPVALLGDIEIKFNHYNSQIEALEAWNRRKKRINYDNLFIIMYDRGGITREDILKLENIECKNKIVLTNKNYDIDYTLQIKPNENKVDGQVFLDRDILCKRTFEKYFDFVKFLNCED